MVSPELGPQNIKVLLLRLQKLGKVMDHVSRLVENPGGNDWPPGLQIKNSSGADFLSRLKTSGTETKILNDELLPSLERAKAKLAQTIVLVQPEEDLKQIRQLAQQKIIPKDLLERAEKEFKAIRVETKPQPVIQRPEEAVVTPPPAVAEPVVVSVFPSEQQDQERLTFEVDGKVINVPKKEFYTNEDIAAAIGRDKGYVSDAVDQAKRKNPSITAGYFTIKYSKILSFDEENFIRVITDIMARMRSPRDTHKRGKAQTPEKPENVAPILPEDKGPEKTQEDKIVFMKVDNNHITLDGERILLRGLRSRKLLKDLAEAGETGLAPEKLAEEDLANGADPELANVNVRNKIAYLREVLRETGFLVPNIRQWDKRENRVYRLVRQSYQKDRQSSIPPILPQKQTSALAFPFTPLTIASLVEEARKTQQPLTQATEEQTILAAEPETPASVATLVARQEDFVILPNADFSPLPGIVVSPVKEMPRPESRRRIDQKEKDQVILKAIVDVLSKMATRKPEEISRSIRVILGVGLAPRTTLPQVFGPGTTDDDLKTDFVRSLANMLKYFWDKDPKTTKDISGKEAEIINICRDLKRQNYSISSLVHDVSRSIHILSPSKDRAA